MLRLMTRIAKHEDVSFGESFFGISGKGFNMMNMSVGNVVASWTRFNECLPAFLTCFSPNAENQSSEAMVFEGISNCCQISNDSTTPIRMFFSDKSSGFLGNRKFPFQFRRLWDSSKCFSPASGFYFKFQKSLKNCGRITVEHGSNLLGRFAVCNVFSKQKVFLNIVSSWMISGIVKLFFFNSESSAQSVDSSCATSKMFSDFMTRPFLNGIQVKKFFFGYA